MYHLGWFLGPGFGIQPWNPRLDGPWVGSNVHDWTKPDIYVDLTASLERAGFDFLLIEDTSQIDDTFKGSAETTLRVGLWAPKNDPMPLVPLLAARTKHIGLVPTVTSTFYPPYLAARLLTTLDHLTEGRVGFNLVTASSPQAAQNYGYDDIPSKDVRYEMATEWVDVVKRLQASWEPDAVIADIGKGIYADHRKVHRIDHVGKYFKVRGPLNTIPGPQYPMPMVQAGNSEAGRELTARFSNVLLGMAMNVDEMKSLRADMHRRLRIHGRDPASCKVLFIVQPILGATDAEAQAKAAAQEAARWSPEGIEYMLWYLEHVTGVDLSGYDLDTPAGSVMASIEKAGRAISSVYAIFKGQEDRPLREVLATRNPSVNLGLIGSPETVAAQMDEMMQEVGGDGFLFSQPTTRLAIAEICDGLAPVLRRRGSIRSGFEGATFMENLMAF